MYVEYDFQKLANHLLANALNLLDQWLPGGRLIGKEYTCGNISGGKGDSLKVNIGTGKWSDFAQGEQRGNDLISLYATINGISNPEAYRMLSDTPLVNPPNPVEAIKEVLLVKPPGS